ncbi:hypothetical protein VTI74DRAFT_10088 [Chaetomium olivicolor]
MDEDQRSVATDPEADVDRLNEATQDPSAIVETVPVEEDSLGAYSVACLLFNRMIGSGIFNSSAVVFHNTQSVGVSMLLWLYGVVLALFGLVLYIDFGLTIPRYELEDGTKISTPRSGGELPYINYLLKSPKYLMTCTFGISFIVFANTSTNCVAFAVAVLQGAGATATAGKIVGIAIGVNTFSCLLHSMSRKWGIRLNNVLGSVKLLMLVVMVIFGLKWLDRKVADANFDLATSFSRTPATPTGVFRYGEAMIYVIFPFGGFHQANYVLAEIKQPRKNFAKVSSYTVVVICTLFMVIHILYAAVIPKELLFQSDRDIALEFFNRTIGQVSSDPRQVQAACGALRALSAIGNVIVFTFTAARVKQEIAKEGVLPFSLQLASSYEFHWRRWPYFSRLPDHTGTNYLHAEKAPAGALALHWTVTTVFILGAVLGTSAETATDGTFSHLPGYSFLLTAYAYAFAVFWFTVIGVGMMYLRLWPGSRWRYKSRVPHPLGAVAAVVFTAANAVPLITVWVWDPMQNFIARSGGKVPWFAGQTMAVAVLGAAGGYWVGFRFYLWQRKARKGEVRRVTRSPVFWQAPRGEGRAIVDALVSEGQHTTIVLSRETSELKETEIGTRILAVNYSDINALATALETSKVEVIISTIDVGQGAEAEHALIQAAAKSSVTKRYIPSIWGIKYTEQITMYFPFAKVKIDIIEALEGTSLDYTSVLNGYFLDYFFVPKVKSYMPPMALVLDIANNFAAIPGSGDIPVVFTHSFDVAHFVAALVKQPRWEKESHIIGDRVTWKEFLRLAEEAKGTKFTVVHDSVEKLRTGQITELPSHPSLYPFFPKQMLQGFFAAFGIMFEQGEFDLQPSYSLNDQFPDIKPRTIKKGVGFSQCSILNECT